MTTTFEGMDAGFVRRMCEFRAVSALRWPNYVPEKLPKDVKAVAMDVLRHRVLTTYEAEAEGLTSEQVVRTVLDTVPVP